MSVALALVFIVGPAPLERAAQLAAARQAHGGPSLFRDALDLGARALAALDRYFFPVCYALDNEHDGSAPRSGPSRSSVAEATRWNPPGDCSPGSSEFVEARYYDPETGRFLTRDPIGVWGDPDQFGNGYSAFAGSPLNSLDPFGLDDLPAGHHIVPQAVWRDMGVSDAARTFFDSEAARITNKWYVAHNYGPQLGVKHSEFNSAVGQILTEYAGKIGTAPSAWTEANAKGFFDFLTSGGTCNKGLNTTVQDFLAGTRADASIALQLGSKLEGAGMEAPEIKKLIKAALQRGEVGEVGGGAVVATAIKDALTAIAKKIPGGIKTIAVIVVTAGLVATAQAAQAANQAGNPMTQTDKRLMAMDFAWDILSPLPISRDYAGDIYNSMTGGAANAFGAFGNEDLSKMPGVPPEANSLWGK